MGFKTTNKSNDINNVEVTGSIYKVFCQTKKFCKFVLRIEKDNHFTNVLCAFLGDMSDKKEGNSIHIGGEITTLESEYKGNKTWDTVIKINEYE